MKVPLYWTAALATVLGLALSSFNVRPVAVAFWLFATFCAAAATQFKEK